MSPRPSDDEQGSKSASNELVSPPPHDEKKIATPATEANPGGLTYITGWRLHLITAGLCLGLFLVNFEVTVVSTALVSITNNLQDYARSSWIITAYLLTYTGCLVIWARLSDIIGRKWACVSSFFIFAAWSGACGGAQTMVQLIIFRVLQGVGGSGMYGMTTIMLYELVPPAKFPLYTTFVMILFAIGFALGPVLGGLITNSGSWRWVFLLK
ncbi:unnamed protein product [Clonostachys rosea f. rosea IK726]|uniref:Uncharacterized protein n=1 Tax=Clonostachys rosea f. rosea IK726 TaxID=1349383 RepID=A0ACA9TPK2_BIOOC|nr:unnamed protein product [Clonostachys rosea f. rosea IK726]